MRKIVIFMLSVMTAFVFIGCDLNTTSSAPPNISFAKDYTLYGVSDCSIPGRVRKSWTAFSKEATTFESRAQTAMKAAIELQQSSGAQVVQVFLEAPGSDEQIANAWYALDGKGMDGNQNWKWQVTALRGASGQDFLETYDVR